MRAPFVLHSREQCSETIEYKLLTAYVVCSIRDIVKKLS